VFKSITSGLRGRADPQRLVYDAQKLKLRLTRLAEAFERLSGARPGPKLQVQFSGTERLEDTIRKAARRVSLGIISGTFIIATGVTANSAQVGSWLPITLGVVGGILAAGLLVDIVFRRG
jgi:hypothetical protein